MKLIHSKILVQKTITYLLLLGTLLFLSACNKNKKPQKIIEQWSQLKTWSFNGKMAINDGNNNGSGRVEWLVTDDTTQAQFKAPLGQGSWRISETKNNAQLISSTNGESHGDNAQQLISYELGWYFPWDNLQYWLRGLQTNENIIPIKQAKAAFIDSDWHITYTQWTQTPLGLLPKKMTAKKPPYSVKLIIYNWDFE